MNDPVTIDFETEAIVEGSGVPPKPVGVAVWIPGDVPRYYSWGHPEGNNCEEYQAKQEVSRLWDRGVLYHHGKFDIRVAQEHWSFGVPKTWDDTMYQIYLHNPLARSVSLKPSAEALLGMPPDEQDAIADWVVAHGYTKSRKEAGAFICMCPAGLVEPYAIGDVVRTRKLHDKLHPEIIERNWESAYRRELELAPILMDMERRGVRIDRVKLGLDILTYEREFARVTNFLGSLLGADINLDSGTQLAKALIDSGLVDRDALSRTPTGKISTARASLQAAVRDPALLGALRYRGALRTLLGTFMKPWYEVSARDGRVHPSWNQVRGDDYGTRTGRLSCSHPNLQNVPTEFEGLDLPDYEALPFMRRYILPEEGEILLGADFNGQEMRLLAHFAEGRAAEIYNTNPEADFHEIARNILHDEAGLDFPRKKIKITGFSLIYGAGVNALAKQLGVEYGVAYHLRDMYLRSIPGLREFINDVSNRRGIRTWGGRWIPAELGYEYKLANHLIQGTAADQTKQAMIEYMSWRPSGRLLMTVHDEIVTSTPKEHLRENAEILKRSMEKLPGFDVPFRVEIETGYDWHNMKPYYMPGTALLKPGEDDSNPLHRDHEENVRSKQDTAYRSHSINALGQPRRR